MAVDVFAPGNLVRAAGAGGTHRLAVAVSTTVLNMLAWIPRWALDAPLLLALCVLLIDPAILAAPGLAPRAGHLRLVSGGCPGARAPRGLLHTGLGDRRTDGRQAAELFVFAVSNGAARATAAVESNAQKTGIAIGGESSGAPHRCFCLERYLAVRQFPARKPRIWPLRIPQWAASRRAALAALEAHHGDRGSATFPELPPYPHMYFDYDISQDPQAYPNRSVARYYGLQSITGPRPPAWPDGAALSGRTFGSFTKK